MKLRVPLDIITKQCISSPITCPTHKHHFISNIYCTACNPSINDSCVKTFKREKNVIFNLLCITVQKIKKSL